MGDVERGGVHALCLGQLWLLLSCLALCGTRVSGYQLMVNNSSSYPLVNHKRILTFGIRTKVGVLAKYLTLKFVLLRQKSCYQNQSTPN